MSKHATAWALATQLLFSAAGQAQLQAVGEWLSFGYKRNRSGWNPGQTTVSLAKFRSMLLATMVLFAMNARTGKELYSSRLPLAGWANFTQPAVPRGKVFLISHDAHVYAFDLKR